MLKISLISVPDILNDKKRADVFLDNLLISLESALVTPDKKIIVQDDKKEASYDMFWVVSGQVKIKVTD